jgi:hypothetical protein
MWGEHYFPKVQDEHRTYALFPSKDIDFFGDATVASGLARIYARRSGKDRDADGCSRHGEAEVGGGL